MNRFWKYYERALKILTILGASCLVAMVLLTCADVVGRFFKQPIFGSVEIVTILATLAVSFALPFTHKEKGHIGVEILVRLLSKKVQTIIGLCTSFLSLGLFGIITWRMALYAMTMKKTGEVSMNLELPIYLIICAMSFSFLVFFLLIFRDIMDGLKALKGDG